MAPMAIVIAAAAVSAVGKLAAGQAQARSFESQKQAANYNATAQMQNANSALAAASANEMAMRRDNDVKLSFERARTIESGGGLVGTNVGAIEQSGANLELSALNARYRGAVQAHGDLQQAQLDQYQGEVAGMNESSAKTSAWIGAAGSALGGAASYSSPGAGGFGGMGNY